MIDIFGPQTHRLLRLVREISELSPEDVEAVAEEWRRTPEEDRAAAWAVIQKSASPHERIAVMNAAAVARHRALTVPQPLGHRDWAFWSAAWDAAGAVAAAGIRGEDPSYEVLLSPMATRLPWLSLETAAPEIPQQRGMSERGARHEPAPSPRGGRRR